MTMISEKTNCSEQTVVCSNASETRRKIEKERESAILNLV